MSKFFINRPIVAMVISIVTVILGVITIVSLPVAQFPNIAPPEIQIQAVYVGADAQTLEQSVATPIEQQMSGVDNMNYMYSINASDGSLRMTTRTRQRKMRSPRCRNGSSKWIVAITPRLGAMHPKTSKKRFLRRSGWRLAPR